MKSLEKYRTQLNEERIKLDNMVEQIMKKGGRLNDDPAILKQSQIVDWLVNKLIVNRETSMRTDD